MEEKSLALNVNEAMQLGEVLYKSGYFADVKNAAQAVVFQSLIGRLKTEG